MRDEFRTRMTTCLENLENLEMSGILTAVREISGILWKVREMTGKCQGKIFLGKVPTTVYCYLHICVSMGIYYHPVSTGMICVTLHTGTTANRQKNVRELSGNFTVSVEWSAYWTKCKANSAISSGCHCRWQVRESNRRVISMVNPTA